MFRSQVLALLLATSASGAVLTVGPKGKYAKPCAAFGAAQEGDTIEIDAAGDYTGDVCVVAQGNLLIRGVNGRPRINAAGRYAEYKGIWVFRKGNMVVENIEMFGAKVPDRNGAAIRHEGGNLTLRWVHFHDNEDGILVNPGSGDILIEYSEFDRNGSVDGSAHNIYIGADRRLTVRYCYFHRGLLQGNVLKSRAKQNIILFSRMQSEDADSSWELDLSNGGDTVLVGNVIQQGSKSGNFNLVDYMMEGNLGYRNFLLVAYNTFVNQGAGRDENGPALFFVMPTSGDYSGLVMNNIFAGPGELASADAQSKVRFVNNLTGVDPLFVDADGRDFRISDLSPAVGQAMELPADFDQWSYPAWQIQPAACAQHRPQFLAPSLGAFEPGITDMTLGELCHVIPQDLSAMVSLLSNSFLQSTSQVALASMDGVAPPEGAEVSLYYSHPGNISGPSKVSIPGGKSSVPITLNFTVPDRATVATITAAYRDQYSDTFVTFPIPEPPSLKQLILSPAQLAGGATTTENVILLSAAAIDAGAAVSLRSSRPDLATVPSSITIPTGASQANFPVVTKAVPARIEVVVTAAFNGLEQSAVLVLEPVTPGSITAPGRTLGAPARHMLTLRLTGPAPASGLLVQLSSDHPETVALPPSVTVPADGTTVSFPADLSAVSSATKVRIQATAGNRTAAANILVDSFQIDSLLLSPATVPGGVTTSTHRLVLNSPAPADQGITFQLSSSNPGIARVAQSVTVSPGFSGVDFIIATSRVNAATEVTITASTTRPLGGPPQISATLTVVP